MRPAERRARQHWHGPPKPALSPVRLAVLGAEIGRAIAAEAQRSGHDISDVGKATFEALGRYSAAGAGGEQP